VVSRPRVFVLVRFRDVSGVSGTGVVAEGVEWSDGSASLRWFGSCESVAFWPRGVLGVETVHGHGGATVVRFLDPPDAGPACSCPAAPGAGPGGEGGWR
jgi:hypothetical protein